MSVRSEKKDGPDKNNDSGGRDTSPARMDDDIRALFDLEERYPEVDGLFAPHPVSSTDKADVLVSLDTNALLLPYSVGKSDLNAIAEVYRRLAKEERLYLPARAAREFIKLRDRKIAEMIKGLDGNFQIAVPTMLESLTGYKEMLEAATSTRKAQAEYDKAKASVIAGIKNWRGNDPVTALYHDVFTKSRIIEHDGQGKDVAKEWRFRWSRQIPPGYKDANKDDTGIGDFLIWKAILKIGASRKQDLVFVTGEAKADWFVRVGGGPIYPRPELVDEYRRFSKGHNFRLATLADMLGELNVSGKVVREVRAAETKANEDAVKLLGMLLLGPQPPDGAPPVPNIPALFHRNPHLPYFGGLPAPEIQHLNTSGYYSLPGDVQRTVLAHVRWGWKDKTVTQEDLDKLVGVYKTFVDQARNLKG